MRVHKVSLKGMALLLVMPVFACDTTDPPLPEPVIRPVRSQQVFIRGGARERVFAGIAEAGAEIKLSFKVPGTLRSVEVNVGDLVWPDTLVAELDPRDYELQVEDVEASLAQAKAQERNAVADLKRVRGLWENSNASADDLDAARTASESARATVASTVKKVELARRQLSYTRLLSPVEGAVAEVQAEVNENVNAGQPIALITTGARPEVEVAVPEGLITQIRQGSQVSVTFDAMAGRSYSAVVTEVGVAPTQSATTFPVKVQLNRSDTRILPGMSAEVLFRFGNGSSTGRIVVPPQAVSEDQEGNFVYIITVGESGLAKVHRRSVEVGDILSEGLEIREGLEDGELIVTAGVSRIEDGQRVKLLSTSQGES
jgi:RND family efflux transporter MFP subunit